MVVSRAILGHCDLGIELDLWPHAKNHRVGSISPTLFEVGIKNLMYGCILRWPCVAYNFWVTVPL